MRKRQVAFLLILMSIFLVACSEGHSDDYTVFNQELDFRSVLDTETGAILSLGDSKSYFEEVFGAGESVSSELALRYDGELERYRFLHADGRSATLVEFLDDKAVDMLVLSGFEFAHISFDTMMDDLPIGFKCPYWITFDNNRHAIMSFDSYGNLITDGEQSAYRAYRLHVRAHSASGGNVISSIQLRWLEPLHLVENNEKEISELPPVIEPVPEYITIRGEQFCISLTELELSGRNDWRNEDIIPLRYMTNLTTLVLLNIPISDITPLAELTNLTELSLWNVSITDLTILSNFTNLRKLNIDGGQITDISPLATLINLEELSLFANEVNDISPLSNLTSLTRLNLEHNQVNDISALTDLVAMEELALNSNFITDISPLANMMYLRILELGDNEVSDLSPLSRLVNLENLWLRSNRISDISPLTNLVNLEVLSLTFNEVSDITPLSNLRNLEFLCVGGYIYDWSPVDHVDFVSGRP